VVEKGEEDLCGCCCCFVFLLLLLLLLPLLLPLLLLLLLLFLLLLLLNVSKGRAGYQLTEEEGRLLCLPGRKSRRRNITHMPIPPPLLLLLLLLRALP